MLSKEEILEAIPYLSASRIHTYIQCPSAFFLKYVYKIADAKTTDSYANYGTLLHNIYENIANGKYDSVETPIKEYQELYGGCGLTKEQYKDYYEQGLQSIYDKWEFLHNTNVIQAEAKFSAYPIPNAPKFFGFVDLVYRDEKGRLIVRDYKTSKKYTKQQLTHNVQAYVYAEACKVLYGEYPYAFEFDFVRFGTKHLILIDENYIKFNRLLIEGFWKQIVNGVQTGKWTGFYCKNFCEGRNHCPIYQIKMGGK